MNDSENTQVQPCLMTLASGLSEKAACDDPGEFRSSRVLIVDDEDISKLILSRICSELGASFETAPDGAAALELLDHHRFEVVLLDRSMPGMDGFEVLREIRKRFSEADLPVVMVTADDDRESIVSAFRAGANDYITKPFDSGTSLVRLSTHLRIQQIQNQLSESQQRYTLAVRGTNDGIWDWDILDGSVYFSPRWQAMLGLEELEYSDSPNHWFCRIHDNDRKRVHDALAAHLAGQSECFEVELRMHHELGEYRWMLCRGKAVFAEDGKALRMAGSLTDVTEGKSADALTGLPNRALFLERVSHRLQQHLRNPSRTFAVAMIDVDGFKGINDTYGHSAGDELLVLIARRLESSVRQADSVVARIGGDEFAVLIEDLDSQRAASSVAGRLVEAVSKPALLQDCHCVNPSVSVGITLPTPETRSVDDLVLLADRAMYQVKREGKHGYRMFCAAMQQEDKTRSALLEDLNTLAELGRAEQAPFDLVGSPILEVPSGDLFAIECRLAWSGEDAEEARPGFVAEVARDNGLDPALELCLLKTACARLAAFKENSPRHHGGKIMVESSLWGENRRQLVDTITQTVSSEGVSPEDVILSVSHGSSDQPTDEEHNIADMLRERGFTIALSGFELNHVSLGLLKLASHGYLRIGDRRARASAQPHLDPSELDLVATLANTLHAGLIYSGVSDHNALGLLHAAGCEYAHGPLFGQERTFAEILDSLPIRATV